MFKVHLIKQKEIYIFVNLITVIRQQKVRKLKSANINFLFVIKFFYY